MSMLQGAATVRCIGTKDGLMRCDAPVAGAALFCSPCLACLKPAHAQIRDLLAAGQPVEAFDYFLTWRRGIYARCFHRDERYYEMRHAAETLGCDTLIRRDDYYLTTLTYATQLYDDVATHVQPARLPYIWPLFVTWLSYCCSSSTRHVKTEAARLLQYFASPLTALILLRGAEHDAENRLHTLVVYYFSNQDECVRNLQRFAAIQPYTTTGPSQIEFVPQTRPHPSVQLVFTYDRVSQKICGLTRQPEPVSVSIELLPFLT